MGAASQQRKAVQATRVLDQQARAFELRVAGHNIREIAAELGVSMATAHRRIEDEITDRQWIPPDKVQAWRELELDRLDKLHRATLAAAAGADRGTTLAAVDRMLRISERRSKLLGLDTPVEVKLEANVNVHEVDGAQTALAELINEAKAKAAADEERLQKQAGASSAESDSPDNA